MSRAHRPGRRRTSGRRRARTRRRRAGPDPVARMAAAPNGQPPGCARNHAR